METNPSLQPDQSKNSDKPEDDSPEVIVSDDKLSASVKLPAKYKGTGNDILKLLHDKKIVFGIDKEALNKGLEAASASQEEHIFKVASGIPPIDAKDGSIELKFNPSGRSGLISKSGWIDYRESAIIVSVSKNQVLAALEPPVDGTPGTNVFNRKITPARRRGIQQRLRAGQNVKLVDNTMIATKDGYVTLKGNSINVSEHLTVPGDVSYSVGNIHFHGHVTVKGDIYPGFIVEAEDDITVQGNVTDATVKSGRNILIVHGVDGEGKSLIKAVGNIRIGFVENSRIEAGGDIEVASHVINSTLHSGGSIKILKGKGVAIASELKATTSIDLKIAGHETSRQTLLALGGGLETDKKIDKIDHEIRDLKEKLKHLKNKIGEENFSIVQDDPGLVDELPDDDYKNLLRQYLDVEENILTLAEDKNILTEKMNNEKKGAVSIKERIGGACVIEIGSLHLAEPEPKPGPLTYFADFTEGEIKESAG